MKNENRLSRIIFLQWIEFQSLPMANFESVGRAETFSDSSGVSLISKRSISKRANESITLQQKRHFHLDVVHQDHRHHLLQV